MNSFSFPAFMIRSPRSQWLKEFRKFLGDRTTKNFRGNIRTRDQEHHVGIGESGWILKKRRRGCGAGGFRNYVLVEQKNADRVEHFLLRNQTHFIHQLAESDHICFEW